MNPQDNSDTRRYYDAESVVYDEIRYQGVGGMRVDRFQKHILRESFADLAGGGGRILEVGCGTGRLTEYVQARFGSTVGMDFSLGMLSVARERRAKSAADGGYDLVQASATDLPFADHSFTGALSILVLNLIPDYEAVLREVFRVLVPGGRLVISVPNLSSVFFPVGSLVNARHRSLARSGAGRRHGHWFGFGEIRAALQHSGFNLIKVQGQPPWVRRLDKASALPGHLPGRWLSRSLYLTLDRKA